MRLQKHQWVSMACISVGLLLTGSLRYDKLYDQLLPPPQPIAQIDVAPVPVLTTELVAPSLSAAAAVAIDQASGAVLWEKNATRIYAPASTTKLMTALVAREVFGRGAVLTVPALSSVGGTTIGLRAGEQLSIESLLEGALISSGNDAAYTIAANHPAGVQAFIERMNRKAQLLQLSNTYFENATGFDSAVHRTTAIDLALLAREVMKDQLLRAIVRTSETTILDLTGKQKHILRNTNQLLREDQTVIGVKTGTTEEAGQVLITQFQEGEQQYVIVILGSTDRYQDTRMLRDWVRESYTWLSPEEALRRVSE